MKILIAEDDDRVAQMLWDFVELLSQDRVRVSTLSDAIDAADRINPDVLLIDIYMPGRPGCENTGAIDLQRALPRLRERHPDMVIVVISAMIPEGQTTEALLAAGADTFAEKTEILGRAKLLEVLMLAFSRKDNPSFRESIELLKRVIAIKREVPHRCPDVEGRMLMEDA